MDLIKLADALDAAADVIDEQASRLSEVDAAKRTEKLAALRGKIEPLLRDPDAEISDEALEKVAADATLTGLLSGLAPSEESTSSSLGDAVSSKPKTAASEDEKDPEHQKLAAQTEAATQQWEEFCRGGL